MLADSVAPGDLDHRSALTRSSNQRVRAPPALSSDLTVCKTLSPRLDYKSKLNPSRLICMGTCA